MYRNINRYAKYTRENNMTEQELINQAVKAELENIRVNFHKRIESLEFNDRNTTNLVDAMIDELTTKVSEKLIKAWLTPIYSRLEAIEDHLGFH
jgi:uncharacterized protein YnzC (UPF0291/DUF896 family)